MFKPEDIQTDQKESLGIRRPAKERLNFDNKQIGSNQPTLEFLNKENQSQKGTALPAEELSKTIYNSNVATPADSMDVSNETSSQQSQLNFSLLNLKQSPVDPKKCTTDTNMIYR